MSGVSGVYKYSLFLHVYIKIILCLDLDSSNK